MSAQVVSGGTIFFVVGAIALASLATAASAMPVVTSAVLPALAGGIFVYSSVAESAGTKSKGLARWNSAQACALAAQQESILAEAEVWKAYLPFGVGLTAIFAACCVTLKLFDEEMEEILGEGAVKSIFDFDDFLVVLFAVASVAGAIVTNDYALRMRITLQPAPDDRSQGDDTTEWEAKSLPSVVREPDQVSRWASAGLTAVLSCVPLLLVSQNWASEEPNVEGIIDQISVVVSATAAAQAATVFLFAEKDFADAERRIAIQAKQAALSELFFAQSQAEAAIIPAGTAMSGAALGAATVAVEFSRLLAAVSVWPGVLSTFRSTISSVIARVESDASWLEYQVASRGQMTRVGADALASAVKEIERVQKDFKLDQFYEEVRQTLVKLSPGDSFVFRSLPRERRRRVHLVAAELGMASQSEGSLNQRVVVVTNSGAEPTDLENAAAPENWAITVFSDAKALVQEEVQDFVRSGLPDSYKPLAATVTTVSLGVAVSPFFDPTIAKLVLPLVTGSVALLSVWQEKVGKEAVAVAKRTSSKICQLQSRSEGYLGRAFMAYAALPTDFAVATWAMTVAVLGFEGAFGKSMLVSIGSCACIVPAFLATAVAVTRKRRVERHISSACRAVSAKPIAFRWAAGQRRWWVLPILMALVLPVDLPRRVTVAIAGLAGESALVLAAASAQIGIGSYFVARSGRTFSRADAWSQRAQTAIRALPFESAAAVVTTLLSTAFVAFSVPAASVFPIVGLGVCLRALQFKILAVNDASEVQSETESLQDLRMKKPWALVKAGVGTPTDSNPTAGAMLVSRASRGKIRFVTDVSGPLKMLAAIPRSLWYLVRVWDDKNPGDLYAETPAQRAVKSVQADLDEIRVSVRTNERAWFRTLALVGLCVGSAILAPFVLSELATEVVLPVAGAGLTLFAVAAESDARRSVASTKVRAAELKAVVNTMEELLSSASLYRSRLLALAGLNSSVAVIVLVVSHPWHCAHGHPIIAGIQTALQVALTTFHIVSSFICVYPLKGVYDWTEQVSQLKTTSLRVEGFLPFGIQPALLVDTKPPKWSRWLEIVKGQEKWWPVWASLPAILLAFFPLGRSFAKRAVASSAAGACVVAFALFLAERALAGAERSVAGRTRTFALVDALSNEAEQTGAFLPVSSAATIAISGLITFLVELNPYVASGLAIMQAVAWVLASRKASATKYESDASFQVEEVTEGQFSNFLVKPESKFLPRMKQFFLRWPLG